MDLKRIEALLEKYYAGETSLEEERELKHFFSHEDVPGRLEEEKIKFGFYAGAQEQGSGISDEQLISGLREKPKTMPFFGSSKWAVSAMAAGILLAGGIAFLLKDPGLNTKPKYSAANDPQVAYMQTRKALLLMSEKLNKGDRSLEKISKLNEMEVLLTQKNTTK